MKMVMDMGACHAAGPDQIGGKAFALARLHANKISIPKTLCIPTRVFDAYLTRTGIREKIFFELNKIPLEQMRWEELWDTALRIRNFFLTTPLPGDMKASLSKALKLRCKEIPVAVRSSAPGEDSTDNSFAGCHESFLNVSGTHAILKHIKLVWASLYSDAALLYRKELGLDIQTSQMAVVIQELVPSDRSGIFFGMSPSNAGESVIEAVYGLNQALVDGDIEPDRWTLNRASGKLLDHKSPVRERRAVPGKTGITFEILAPRAAGEPPLKDQEVRQIWDTGKALEALFGTPQDVEWTMFNDRLIILQARPITGRGSAGPGDKQSWYLSLHRSHDNLKKLYEKIEHHLIPEMIREAWKMGETDLASLSAKALCKEIEDRQKTYDHWVKVYWAEFIPFAHGIRLFGQVYNDAVAPEDPYEFMTLLESTGLKSMERNRLLEGFARMIREDAALKKDLENDLLPGPDHPFRQGLDSFIDGFGDLSCTTGSNSECHDGKTAVIRLLLEFSSRPARGPKSMSQDIAGLKARYLHCFAPDRRAFAENLLTLGRESYRLRDDDNIHLGRIEARLFEAVAEARSRLAHVDASERQLLSKIPSLSLVPENPGRADGPVSDKIPDEHWVRSRQIVGHPAGPGIASGPARLIKKPRDLLAFKQGEILVCQGVDPNMTFVVPLAAALVEERGGMLIHGAIIAREYGLPCITGASKAMQRIENGHQITVDGYLGIITCQTGEI